MTGSNVLSYARQICIKTLVFETENLIILQLHQLKAKPVPTIMKLKNPKFSACGKCARITSLPCDAIAR